LAEENDDAPKHHDGDEIGKVQRRLHDNPEFPASQFIQKNSQNNGRREPDDNVINIQQKSIADDTGEIHVLEEVNEVFQPNPFTSKDAESRYEIFEGYHNTEHRQVLKQDVVGNNRQQHQVNKPELLEVLAQVRQHKLPSPSDTFAARRKRGNVNRCIASLSSTSQ